MIMKKMKVRRRISRGRLRRKVTRTILMMMMNAFHNKTCIRSAMESVIVGCGFRICLVKLGDQLNPTFTSGSG